MTDTMHLHSRRRMMAFALLYQTGRLTSTKGHLTKEGFIWDSSRIQSHYLLSLISHQFLVEKIQINGLLQQTIIKFARH